MKFREIALLTIFVACMAAVVGCGTSSVSDVPVMDDVQSSDEVTEPNNEAAPQVVVTPADVQGTLMVPSTCTRPVLEVSLEEWKEAMWVDCRDGKTDYTQVIELGSVDTSVSGMNELGASFAAVIMDPHDIANWESSMPHGINEGIAIHTPFPNTCTLMRVDTTFEGETTTARFTCLDGTMEYDRTVMVSMNLIEHSSFTQKGLIPIIYVVLRHPDYVMNN